ncbi:hypothetical protein SAMN05421823_103685 [Catalinimonas alkaloidigena]|uniref:Lipoprotein n=1 Tax=Catalinimonas alkaloidigena TaxID=1075417 RepID=A0A1G9F633_9BACT|nr:hypothetical protein [Catalinimonas alkaloidigena]SDK83897.1 hypothetical protein SAMN05421823_103685 [Catalinimonas alkaloidigena]
MKNLPLLTTRLWVLLLALGMMASCTAKKKYAAHFHYATPPNYAKAEVAPAPAKEEPVYTATEQEATLQGLTKTAPAPVQLAEPATATRAEQVARVKAEVKESLQEIVAAGESLKKKDITRAEKKTLKKKIKAEVKKVRDIKKAQDLDPELRNILLIGGIGLILEIVGAAIPGGIGAAFYIIGGVMIIIALVMLLLYLLE